MRLRFLAREGCLVHWPGLSAYAGRTFTVSPDAAPGGVAGAYVADASPVEADSASEAGKRFSLLVKRDAALWPADAETAAHCGVPFAPVARDAESGEWVRAPDAKPAARVRAA